MERDKRKIHDEASVTDLLAVPRYTDLLEEEPHASGDEEGLSKRQSALIKSREGWRKEMGKWIQEERVCSDDSDSDGEELGNATYGRQRSKWLPRSLELLFGGRKEVDVDEQLK